MILRLVRVENFSIFETAEATFDVGLTVVSGESGAGKTLLLEAIRLALGGRPEAGVVRAGCDQAVIEVLFEVGPGELTDLADEDGQIVVRRQISAAGRSIFHLNGQVALASLVRQAGGQLVDMTSQGEPAEILSLARQRSLLDRFAGLTEVLAERAAVRGRIRQLEASAATLGGDEQSRRRQLDLLTYQTAEIEAARLEVGEEERHRQRRRILAEREALLEALSGARTAILGGGRPGAYDLVARAEAALGRFRSLSPEISEWADEAKGVLETIQDLGQRLAVMSEGMEMSGDEAARLDERLLLIEELKRKYGDSIDAVLTHGEAAGRELQRLQDAESELADLEASQAALAAEAARLEQMITQGRQEAASRLAPEVEAELEVLGFPSARFRVDVDGEAVSFWFQPNPGEAPQPVTAIASGGEQSRLLLALRQVAKADERRVLLLDEVDQGLGGDSAKAVARRLQELARLMQVMAVTHQAVVATHADHHLLVSKQVVDARTVGVIECLTGEARVAEVARMLAGSRPGLSRDHARELLRLNLPH